MEERIQRSATSFTQPSQGVTEPAHRFETPTVVEVSLCCEISAYAPDGDDQPLF